MDEQEKRIKGGVIYNRGAGRTITRRGVTLDSLEPILQDLLALGFKIQAPIREPGCNCDPEHIELSADNVHQLVNGRGWGYRKLSLNQAAAERIASGTPRAGAAPEPQAPDTQAQPAAGSPS